MGSRWFFSSLVRGKQYYYIPFGTLFNLELPSKLIMSRIQLTGAGLVVGLFTSKTCYVWTMVHVSNKDIFQGALNPIG